MGLISHASAHLRYRDVSTVKVDCLDLFIFPSRKLVFDGEHDPEVGVGGTDRQTLLFEVYQTVGNVGRSRNLTEFAFNKRFRAVFPSNPWHLVDGREL